MISKRLFFIPVFIASLLFFVSSGSASAADTAAAADDSFTAPQETLPLPISDTPQVPDEVPAESAGHRERPMRDIGPAGLLDLARNLAVQGEVAEAENTYRLLIDRFPDSDKRNVAFYELGILLYKNARIIEARSYLERVASSWWVEPALREKTRVLLREIDSVLKRGTSHSELPAIGLILPLTGRYAPYGEAALKGALLAAHVFGGGSGGDIYGSTVDVFVRDVGGSAAEGSRAVKELAEDKRVVGVVGPLLNATAYQSAAMAESRGLPLITLSQKEDVTGAGQYVFRNSLSPTGQAKAVAEYAVNVLGKSQFAVLYPDNHSGKVMAEAFMETVITLGREITAQRSYEDGTKDFGLIMRELFMIETDEVQEGRRTISEYFPSAAVDALYIPDSYKTVSLISPYIKYYNIDDVQLLGSSGWNSRHLVELAGRAVEGAVFVDGFFPKSRRDSSASFAIRFKETYGREAGEVEAEAYDATRLLIKAIDTESPDRDLVRERLLDMSDYEGAEGSVYFDSYGGAVKDPFILTVKGRSIVEAPKPELIDLPEAEENLY